MKKLLALVLSLPVMAGCQAAPLEIESAQNSPPAESSTFSPSQSPQSEPEQVAEYENVWQEKCSSYEPISGQPWHEVYNQIIDHVCLSTALKPDVVEIIYSPLVNQDRLQSFVETLKFSFSYWSPITLDTAPVKVILLNEKEEQWFRETLTPLLKDPSVITWFGPEAPGVGRCGSTGSQASCGAKYPVWETTTGTLVYVTQLGSLRMPDLEFNIEPSHNAVHWYQDSHGFEHWDFGFLEGQATMFEIAFHILFTGSDRKREEGAWLAMSRDIRPFRLDTLEEAIEHEKLCSFDSRECNHFQYFGGAMQQEKLIIDFGFEKYLEWISAVESVRSRDEYRSAFEAVYGEELDAWKVNSWLPYALESFASYR